jgi:hypothetical protein
MNDLVVPARQSRYWWNRKGFASGAQATLDGVRYVLSDEQTEAIQLWIDNDLRDWADAAAAESASSKKAAPIAEAPPFPPISGGVPKS